MLPYFAGMFGGENLSHFFRVSSVNLYRKLLLLLLLSEKKTFYGSCYLFSVSMKFLYIPVLRHCFPDKLQQKVVYFTSLTNCRDSAASDHILLQLYIFKVASAQIWRKNVHVGAYRKSMQVKIR